MAGSSAPTVTERELLRLREITQRIHPAAGGTVTETVRHLLAIQAQDFGNALWAVGLRTKDSTRSSVLAALDRGEVVRSLPMRGTLHFVAAEDLRWMLDLTSGRTLQGASARFRNLGLDHETLRRTESIARMALAGTSMSREEFMALLERNGISPEGQRGYHVIFYLAQLGVVCWGPTSPRQTSGTQQELVLLDDWIPASAPRERNAALAGFAERYFAGHGPATERDFAWWTKLTLKDVRAAIANCGTSLTELTCGGVSYWIATAELEAAELEAAEPEAAELAAAEAGAGEVRAAGDSRARSSDRAASVRVLPGFDEYLLGYQDRSLPLAAEHSQRIVPGNNGIFLPTIVAKGRIVGTWRRA
jgi:hypothetical protein